MLRTPAPFPQVGSYALIELEGRNHLARIVHRTHGGDAVISLPLMPDVASGNRTVEFGQLLDGTPLSDFETRELDQLESEALGKTRPARGTIATAAAKQDRREALRARIILAPILADFMKRLPDPTLRASKAAA